MPYRRYAIYFTPAPGPLASFASSWLGWDIESGTAVGPPALPDLGCSAHELTTSPRRYGFHATIKPPFELAPPTTFDQLASALAQLCLRLAPVPIGQVSLARLGRFLALVPTAGSDHLREIAGQVVSELDPFRAPLSNTALERRLQQKLSAGQHAMLLKWGYPHVMDEFRFHMTLTNRLPRAQAKHVQETLDPVLAPLLNAPLHLDALGLCGEDENGFFHLLSRHPLSGPSKALG